MSDKPLKIRLTVEDRTLLDRAAEYEGLPTSTWGRDLMLETARAILKSRAAVAKKKGAKS